MSKYDIDAMRRKVQEASKKQDPDEFRPAKAKPGEELKYRFYVLPPYSVGDMLRTGPAKKTLETYHKSYGSHWHNKKPISTCPRYWSGETCEVCQAGFDMMEVNKSRVSGAALKEANREIARLFLSQDLSVVNLYFPQGQNNPPDVAGRVLYYKATQVINNIWLKALSLTGPGDPQDPQAYGAFFDEMAAFLFQLEVRCDNDMNSYKTSKFLANNGVPSPIAISQTGQADLPVIQSILAARHNLHEKLGEPDLEALARMKNDLLGITDDGFSPTSDVIVPPSSKPVQSVGSTMAPTPQPQTYQQPMVQQPVVVQPQQMVQPVVQQPVVQPQQMVQPVVQQPMVQPQQMVQPVVQQPVVVQTQPVVQPQPMVQPQVTAQPQVVPTSNDDDDIMSQINGMLDQFKQG